MLILHSLECWVTCLGPASLSSPITSISVKPHHLDLAERDMG